MDLPEFKIQVFPIKNKLYRLAKRLLGDHEDAQDMIQEVFIRLWGMREKLNEYRSIEAFSVVMTRNMCLDKIKSKKLPVEKMEGLEARLGAMDEEAPEDHSQSSGKDVRSGKYPFGQRPHLCSELISQIGPSLISLRPKFLSIPAENS